MKLKMKSYIKPFEKILGIMELASIAKLEKIEFQDNDIYEIETSTLKDEFIDSLAYWESIGDSLEYNTVQVVLENTYNVNGQFSQINLFGEQEVNIKRTRILRYGVHDIHEYKGKFFPQLVRACINISGVKCGSIVLDPFCGSGTTLCEARIRGMRTVGIDLNPLSALISRVKTNILGIDKEQISIQYKKLKKYIELPKNINYKNRWNKEDLKYLSGWFDSDALADLDIILNGIETIDDAVISELFKVNLSNIIREISWQKDSDLRVRKEIGNYNKGMAVKRFEQEVEKQFYKMSGYLDYIENFDLPETKVLEGNTVNAVDLAAGLKGMCDVIITSPPYATALPYLDTDRLSIIVLGLMHRKEFNVKNKNMVGNREISEKYRCKLLENYKARSTELTDGICSVINKIAEVNHKPGTGFRRRNLPALLSKYFLDMLDSMKAANALLKPGALAFYVVGNNSTRLDNEKFVIETNLLLWDLAEKVGWKKEKYINMDMLKSTLGFSNNRSTTEAILIFKKEGH